MGFPANDNHPDYDITAGLDGYRVWSLRPNGKPGGVVAEFKSLSSAARFCIAAGDERLPQPLNHLNKGV